MASLVERMTRAFWRILAPFEPLRTCALRELLLVYGMCLVSMLGYFVFSYVLVLHLTEELGLDDTQTGLLYGVFGIAIAVWSIVLGIVVDRIGVRASLIIGNAMGAIGALAFAFVRTDQWLAMALLLLVVLPIAFGLATPAVPIAIRIYANADDATQRLAFSIYYTVTNVSAVLASPLVDVARTLLPGPAHTHAQDIGVGVNIDVSGSGVGAGAGLGVPLQGALDPVAANPLHLPRYALLIAASSVTSAFSALLAVAIRSHARPQRPAKADAAATAAAKGRGGAGGGGGMFAALRATMQHPNFWRFVVLSGALIGVKSTFRYLDALYPIYVERAFPALEVAAVPYMSLLAINPAIVIAFTVAVDRVLSARRIHPVKVIIAGAAIGGSSPLLMMLTSPSVAPDAAFAALRWGAIVAFIVAISIGEVLWSPTLYTYTCALAPRGGEGTFFALAGVPLFAAKLMTGSLSGLLLARFCPAGTERMACDGAAIWGVIGATTASSALLLAAVRGYVTVPIGAQEHKASDSEQPAAGGDATPFTDVCEWEYSDGEGRRASIERRRLVHDAADDGAPNVFGTARDPLVDASAAQLV